MKRVVRVAALLALALASAAIDAACLMPASWYWLGEAKPRATRGSDVLADMARRDVVLLGEHHDDPDHHQWQLQTLAALHVLRPNMVIGFESFPRRVQPVLDQWTAGALSVQQFLERTEWLTVWRYPPELYLPLFHFARLNRIPIVALNVERTMIEAVGARGWDALPAERREGMSRPARPAAGYEAYLFDVYKQHPRKDAAPPARTDQAFAFFVQSQTTWDRAMAEALAARLKAKGETRPLVVGIMGAGHVRHGYGVPHQLRDLGVANAGTLLPLGPQDCDDLAPTLASAVFALAPRLQDKPPPPRLGVRLETAGGAVRLADVTGGSLAEQTGLRTGDELITIGGAPIKSMATVIAAVNRQPAGTWLPLQVRRDGSTIDLVIKFPR